MRNASINVDIMSLQFHGSLSKFSPGLRHPNLAVLWLARRVLVSRKRKTQAVGESLFQRKSGSFQDGAVGASSSVVRVTAWRGSQGLPLPTRHHHAANLALRPHSLLSQMSQWSGIWAQPPAPAPYSHTHARTNWHSAAERFDPWL